MNPLHLRKTSQISTNSILKRNSIQISQKQRKDRRGQVIQKGSPYKISFDWNDHVLGEVSQRVRQMQQYSIPDYSSSEDEVESEPDLSQRRPEACSEPVYSSQPVSLQHVEIKLPVLVPKVAKAASEVIKSECCIIQ